MSATIQDRVTTALADRFVVERELGQGGMATVYLARDRKHDRRVALKVLRPELASSIGASRFLREIGIAARLQHPHVLTLIDSGEIVGEGGATLLYYVMPYVEGESLRDRIARGGALPVSEVTRILREVVDALAYAHRNGLVHRDVKPDNVMLSGQHALVVDFGIARAIAAAAGEQPPRGVGDFGTLTQPGVSIGTPVYMAPEQAAGDAADHRADLYAVGVMAYEMLAGRPPFLGTSMEVLAAQVAAPPPPLAPQRPDVPPALERIVARCLAKAPAQRYQRAEELLEALDELATPGAGTPAAARLSVGEAARAGRARARPWVIAAAGVALAAAAAVAMVLVRGRRERWVHETAIPTIQRLVDAEQADSAFALARRASEIIPIDSLLGSLGQRFTHAHVFRSEPAGARVYLARFDDTTRWELLGTTPTDSVRVPSSVARYRFEKPGYRTATLLVGGLLVAESRAISGAVLPDVVPLRRADAPDPDMVAVRGPTLGEDGPRLGDFLIGRHEVTNAQFKAFVDAGGYRRPELWSEAFVGADGRTLSFELAMARFTDRTGRPGPATWEAGAPSAGQEELPVGGVSWYEAAAFARFAGRSLPTLHHWEAAAVKTAAAYVVPGSNFESQGPVRGGTRAGMSPWGVFDMAGNVREWCWNADGGGKRHIAGGGWTDPIYRFTDQFAHDPFDRSPINGIRLAKYEASDSLLARALTPIPREFRDYASERPVSDAVFRTLRVLYDYDPAPLEARVESRDSTPADWVRETVSFAAAYGGERVTAVLFLPKRHAPPYQTLVFYPGSNALLERSLGAIDGQLFGYLMRGGRAVIVPAYKGMFGRQVAFTVRTNETIAYRDLVVAWGKDLRRTVDYVVSRPEVDSARLAYVGLSAGGRMGGVMVALEPRFKAAVLLNGGFSPRRTRPEADPLHFLPRIHVPTLMLNGRYDDVFPVETAQRPFFQLLGTPPEHKRHVLFDDGHYLPRAQQIGETLGWLDRYLGPVK